MQNIINNKNKIEELQKEINFIESNLSYLNDNNIKFRLIKPFNKYIAVIDIEDKTLIKDIITNYPANETIQNNVKSINKEWINKSPYLIKLDSYDDKYTHLKHYFKISYFVNEGFEIWLNVNYDLFKDKIESSEEATPETAHYKREFKKEYKIINKFNEDIKLSKVRFYNDKYIYYANDNAEAKTIKNILELN